jgi:hypothetical protein
MGLTTKKLQSKLVVQDEPHYYELRDSRGNLVRCCGSATDVNKVLPLFPGCTYHKVYYNIPDTVDVSHTNMGEEHTLPAQQILPQSELEPLDL